MSEPRMTSSPIASASFRFLRIAFRFWPPLEVWWANQYINKRITGDPEQAYPKVYARYLEQVSKVPDLNPIIGELATVVDNEERRRGAIDTRAASLISTLVIVIPLTLLVPQIAGASGAVPRSLILILGIFVVASLIHFAAAVYHAAQSSRIGSLYVPSATSVEALLHSDQQKAYQVLAAQKLSFVKMNEPRMTMKANHLAGAQQMLRRGIVLMAAAAIAGVIIYATSRTTPALRGQGFIQVGSYGGIVEQNAIAP